jgi:hypothetical protein
MANYVVIFTNERPSNEGGFNRTLLAKSVSERNEFVSYAFEQGATRVTIESRGG